MYYNTEVQIIATIAISSINSRKTCYFNSVIRVAICANSPCLKIFSLLSHKTGRALPETRCSGKEKIITSSDVEVNKIAKWQPYLLEFHNYWDLFSLSPDLCVWYKRGKHLDEITVRQGRGRLKMFINLKRIFAPFAFVLFYYLHNYFKYKTLFTIRSVVI